jgi:hypothetical protein
LARDIQRYLDHEPVQARAISAADRISHWCRRPERIRDAGKFAVWLAVIFGVWNLLGIVGLLFQPMPTAQRIEAVTIVALDFCGFVLCFWIGRGTLARSPAMIWAGLVMGILTLAFCLACLGGLGFHGGGWLKDPLVRGAVFSFFAIMAVVMSLVYAAAIAAYLSQGPKKLQDRPR